MTDKISLAQPFFPDSMRVAISKDIDSILSSGRLMMGPWAKKFEDRFAQLTNREFGVSLTSCTTALHIALSFAGIQGKDVLVPAGSFITDVSVVEFAGGRPILIDMSTETLALDVEDLKRKVTPNTRAIIWVHLTGIISHEYTEILDFARERGIFVIEDAAHAHGASIDGRPAGSFGDASTFSFYPTKILTSGTGGILTTDNAELAKYARELRIFGRQEGTGEIVHYGNDWFLDEIRSCVAYHQSAQLEEQLEKRRELAVRYKLLLANQPGLQLLDVPDNCHPSWYQYPVFLREEIDRDEVSKVLKGEHNIEVKGIYKPTHHERIFKKHRNENLKNTEDVLSRSLCLPMHAGVTLEDAERVAVALVNETRKRLV